MAAEEAFDWVRRMGVHEAYHLHPANRVLHWVCIPLELFAAIKLLSVVSWWRLDLSMPVILAVAIVYGIAELGAGTLMTVILLLLWTLTHVVASGWWWLDALGAIALFVVSFVVQTQVGHRVFERGIDDTTRNTGELFRTGNPVPILLVFWYHLVELLFAAGYKPALRLRMEAERTAELGRIVGDPRRRT